MPITLRDQDNTLPKGCLNMKMLFLPTLLLIAATASAADAPSLTGSWKIHSVIAGIETNQECAFTQAV